MFFRTFDLDNIDIKGKKYLILKCLKFTFEMVWFCLINLCFNLLRLVWLDQVYMVAKASSFKIIPRKVIISHIVKLNLNDRVYSLPGFALPGLASLSIIEKRKSQRAL